MKTWSEIQHRYDTALVALYSADEIKQLFRIALAHVTGMRTTEVLANRHRGLSVEENDQMARILVRLAEGEPIQLILGEAYFYGMKLEVSPHTLIPRPETEELVHRIVQDYQSTSGMRLIDVGTGTGCIALTLANHLSSADVWAMDISSEALSVAKRNAMTQGKVVNFLCADILEWEVIFAPDQMFDIIASNPPYITPTEKKDMHANVLRYEPHRALFVEESAPLLFYDHIADFALKHLTTEGALYFEINQYLGEETMDLLRKKGFQYVQLIKDLNGNDRILVAKRK